MNLNNTIELYIGKYTNHALVLKELRKVIRQTPLQETIKWGVPTYTFENKNVIGMATFKNYVGLWFFQGAYLKDPCKVLINAQEGKTKALRQMHFTSPEEINKSLISEYIQESIENQINGIGLKLKKNGDEIILPTELSNEFQKNQNLENCFKELTLAKKREFVLFLEEAKKEDTKLNRLKK